jgi:predicted oxidoreductase
MRLQALHPQGPHLSRIVAGTWRWHLEPLRVESLIEAALQAGITTFDHADIYGNYSVEGIFGTVLGQKPSLRQRMQLVTKCGIKLVSPARPGHRVKHYDTSHVHIVQSVEHSLRQLHTDYIDVLLLHRPDPLMQAEEVAGAFHELHRNGKVLHFGVSNFTAAQFEFLQSSLSLPLVTNQIEISVFHTELLFNGLMEVMRKHGTSPMAWSPLGAGKFFSDSVAQSLQPFCETYACTLPQLLLAWLMKHPAMIFPVIGTTQEERLHEAARAEGIVLAREDWFAVLKTVSGKDVA